MGKGGNEFRRQLLSKINVGSLLILLHSSLFELASVTKGSHNPALVYFDTSTCNNYKQQ